MKPYKTTIQKRRIIKIKDCFTKRPDFYRIFSIKYGYSDDILFCVTCSNIMTDREGEILYYDWEN